MDFLGTNYFDNLAPLFLYRWENLIFLLLVILFFFVLYGFIIGKKLSKKNR